MSRVAVHLKKPWKYVSRDMNWRGAVVGLVIAAFVLADLAIFGNTPGGYIGIGVITVIGAIILRTTAHRRACARR